MTVWRVTGKERRWEYLVGKAEVEDNSLCEDALTGKKGCGGVYVLLINVIWGVGLGRNGLMGKGR